MPESTFPRKIGQIRPCKKFRKWVASMSSRQCLKCGRRYPSSYRRCPYCSGQGEGRRRRPAGPMEIAAALLRRRDSRRFLLCTAFFLVIALLGLIITQCSKPKEPDKTKPSVQTVRPLPISLSQGAASLLTGESVTLTVSGGYDTLIWTSSDEAVAVVENGRITGRAAGTARIAASTGTESVYCDVSVQEPPQPSVAELALNHKDFTMRPGDPPVQMKIRVKETKEAYDGEVVWASQDVTVATVSETGLVERAGRGSTVITATAGGQTLECIVRVK